MAVNDVNNHCLYGSSCFCLSRSLSSNSKVLTHGSKFCSGSTLGCHLHLLIFSAFFSIADLTACDLYFSFNHYFLVPWYSKCVVWIIRTIWNPTRNVEFAVTLEKQNLHFHRTPGCLSCIWSLRSTILVHQVTLLLYLHFLIPIWQKKRWNWICKL